MRIQFLFTAVITALLCTTASAGPASPVPFTYVQPDGSVIRLQKHGDEYFHWTTLAGTKQVMALGEDGWWRPAVFDDSAWRAGQKRRMEVNDRRQRDGILRNRRPLKGASGPSVPVSSPPAYFVRATLPQIGQLPRPTSFSLAAILNLLIVLDYPFLPGRWFFISRPSYHRDIRNSFPDQTSD